MQLKQKPLQHFDVTFLEPSRYANSTNLPDNEIREADSGVRPTCADDDNTMLDIAAKTHDVLTDGTWLFPGFAVPRPWNRRFMRYCTKNCTWTMRRRLKKHSNETTSCQCIRSQPLLNNWRAWLTGKKQCGAAIQCVSPLEHGLHSGKWLDLNKANQPYYGANVSIIKHCWNNYVM